MNADPWKLTLNIHRKSTHCHRYLHYSSATPLPMKRSGFRSLWLRGRRLLKNHKEGWLRERQYLRGTFQSRRNAYPRHVIESWLNRFERELERDPDLLLLRKNCLCPEMDNQIELDEEIEGENRMHDLRRSKKVLIVPYIRGVSDKLRNIAARYGVKSWFSFSGRLGNGLSTTYKDQLHPSKSKYAVYRTMCMCGHGYVGQTERNLKVRLLEHKSATSNSSLSQHLSTSTAHSLDANKTEIVSKEKHIVRRKILESMFIVNTPKAICNAGPSTQLSDMWFSCAPRMHSDICDTY